MIPYGRQDITAEDISAVVNVLNSDFITQGPVVDQFESEIAEYCKACFAVACSNATAALHLGCLALGVGPGDRVWTSPNTFVASANCALYCAAKIDFVDICPETYNLSIDKLENKLVDAEKKGELPKVVIPVHFAGQSCDMQRIKNLAGQYGFKIIEDASHAIGGKYNGKPIGNCEFSDLCVFSFHPVKIITTGEGGVLTTKDEALAKKLKLLRSHGVTRDSDLMKYKPEGDWYYEQVGLGYNYRITDMQCALGLSQLTRLDSYIAKRQEKAENYIKGLEGLPLKLQVIQDGCLSAYHLFVIEVDSNKTKRSQGELYDYLREKGIGVNVHYIPVHTQPYFRELGFEKGDFPNAEKYYKRAISLPMFPTLEEEKQAYVLKSLRKFSW